MSYRGGKEYEQIHYMIIFIKNKTEKMLKYEAKFQLREFCV